MSDRPLQRRKEIHKRLEQSGISVALNGRSNRTRLIRVLDVSARCWEPGMRF